MLQKCLTQEKSLLKLHNSDNRVRLSSGRFRLEIFFYLKKRLNLEYFCILGPCISVFKGSIEDVQGYFSIWDFCISLFVSSVMKKGIYLFQIFFTSVFVCTTKHIVQECICCLDFCISLSLHYIEYRLRLFLYFTFLYLCICALHWTASKGGLARCALAQNSYRATLLYCTKH